MTDPRRTRLLERRDQALDDIIELERQVDSGEIGVDDAVRLRSRYEAEAAEAIRSLDDLDDAPAPKGRSPRRVAAGAAIFAVVALVVTLALVNAVEPRPEGGFVTGGIAADVAAGEAPVDLSQVTNEEMEAVIAANPDVLPMRLALARRYVEAGDFSSALEHYLYVLEREEDPEALMYVGWMMYASGEPATGASLLERSLSIAPDDPLAEWFLANVLLFGLEDPEAAIPLLESVIESGAAPADVIAAAERMLEEARSS